MNRFIPYRYEGPGANMGVRADLKPKPLPPERPTHYSDGVEIQWFVVLKQPVSRTGSYAQLHTEDPFNARDPMGRRVYPNERIIYSARLTEAEYKLGFERLCALYGKGLRPGRELALAIELQEPLP